jgi:ABC-type sugar transport system ATPase subunit
MILVTHDPIDALAPGRRVGVLGDGRLQQLGPPDQLRHRPGNRFVAQALGRFVLINGRAVGRAAESDSSEWTFISEDGSVIVPLPVAVARHMAARPTPDLTLGIRPEDVIPRSPGDDPASGAVLTGWSVVLAEPAGNSWLVTAASGRTQVRAVWASGSLPPVGTLTDWYIPAAGLIWFDGETGTRIDD